ncbi:MAG: FAD-dependent thymidylate synthase [Deltaproteobacteria bacterium]|nr:FAD-dependent thymidylate synthase [Deltaproteobacteria bacterium]
MIVKVAGFNIDIENIEKLNLNDATPETIAASYAKISRDPRPIGEIRKDARENVKNARELNKRVVFDMGHSSIAEHAVFNIDIIGISRLAAEYIERFRLCSYTEKSQRYIKLGEDFVIPDGLNNKLENEFTTFIKDSFSLYEEIFKTLLPLIKERKSYKNEELKKRDIEGLAMEDARYVLPLAVTTQLGLTANARNIEYIIKILASSPFAELQKLSKSIFNETIKYTPSLIRYTEPEKYFTFYWFSDPEIKKEPKGNNTPSNPDVKLISTHGDIDKIIAVHRFWSSSDSFEKSTKFSAGLSKAKKRELIHSIFECVTKHNQMPRFFEAINLEYELTMSASCYAQFKRHRMMTQIPQQYLFELGIEIPPIVRECGFEKKILEHSHKSVDLYKKILEVNKYAADYVILNCHRRRVYALLNARELYHISRLRMDHHAQWEIQKISRKMVELAREKVPFLFDMCCGKDEFDENLGRIQNENCHDSNSKHDV